MITIHKTSADEALQTIDAVEKNSWINMVAPSQAEIREIAERCNIPIEFLEDPLDLEESARIEYDEETNCTLIINDLPIINDSSPQLDSYITIPIGIILGESSSSPFAAKRRTP